MFMLDPKHYQNMYLDYNRILEADNVMPIIKDTIKRLRKNPYMSLKDFFSGLSDEDLTMMQYVAEEGDEDKDAFSNIVLLTELLTIAEGVDRISIDDLGDRVQQFVVFVTIASLQRKGLVKAYLENMSFGSDMDDKIIVEKADD